MSSNTGLNKKDGSIILIVSALVLQVFFFAPLQVLLKNFGEFSVVFLGVFLVFLAMSVALIVVAYLLLRVLKFPFLAAILTFLSTVVFLESRFLLSLAQHQPFDGKSIDWQAIQWLSHIELGVIAAVGIGFMVLYKQTRFFSMLSLFILIFVAGGFASTLFWNTAVVLDERQVETTESRYFDQFQLLSSQRNVIHIVPDQTQGAMVHDILTSDDGHYSEVFDGFTFFTQATGQYQGTYPSVLYYMTGEAPEPEADLTLSQPYTWDYIAETLEQHSIVSVLSDNGFNTFGFQFHPGLFCKGPYTACIGTHDEVFAGVAVNSSERRFKLTIMKALDIALFQSTPIVLRQQVYDDGKWFVRKLDRSVPTHSGILETFSKNLRVVDGPDSYNYFHHAGAHAPLLFDKDCQYVGVQEINRENQQGQVRCTLSQLENMIRALKKEGVYDQTMIVINGDHGTPWLPPSYPGNSGLRISETMIGMSSTLLMIKPPQSTGPLVYSEKAVTIGDIPHTIAGVLGIDNDFSGIQMFSDQPAAGRERHYFSYDDSAKAHDLQALPNMTRYRIQGDVFDENDWVLPNNSMSSNSFSQIRMDDPEFSSHAEGFSILELHSVPSRWVDGKQARVFLEAPGEGSMALVFDCFVPAGIDAQWIEVSVAGRLIGRLEEEVLQKARHVMPLPDDIPRTELIEIQFKMGKSRQFGEDLRQLSVMFSYIGLEPAG
jgi:hypothetical protein